MTALTHCKTATCREAITLTDVIKELPVEGSPQHVLVVYKCSACGHTDRIVGTVTSWNELKEEETLSEGANQAQEAQITRSAQIEVGAIDSVNDLITLWCSYKRPPLREAVLGSCQCNVCEARRSI